MAGIISYGAYIPMWRIERKLIADAVGTSSMGGERAVASWDEDSLTMAVEASLDSLVGIDPKGIDAVYFATVSSPFREKEPASIIASALEFRKDVFTHSITGSMRAGTSAIKLAVDAVKAGSARKVLVTAADSRPAMPKSAFEQIFGDGAVALVIGEDETIADIECFCTLSNAIPGVWQRDKDAYPRTFSVKFDTAIGLLKSVPEVVSELMRTCNVKVKDISKFALHAPDPRGYMDLARSLQMDPKTQLQDPLFDTVGITGTVCPLLLLVSALEEAGDGDRIICASYGEGSDAFLVKTTDKLEQAKGIHRGTAYVLTKRPIPSYERFAGFKGIRDTGSTAEALRSSLVKYWRDERWALSLHGMNCKKCGTLQYPIGRCCQICGEKDDYEEIRIAKKGKIFSYTHDYLMGPGVTDADGINPTTRVVVTMEDGCRLWLEMTDHEPDEIDVDMPIELTLRILHQKAGFPFYGWRARPSREINLGGNNGKKHKR